MAPLLLSSLPFRASRPLGVPSAGAFGMAAEKRRRAGDVTGAIALCRDGLADHPGHVGARVTLGLALMATGADVEAFAALQYAVRLAPDNLAAIRGLAELHERGITHDGPGFNVPDDGGVPAPDVAGWERAAAGGAPPDEPDASELAALDLCVPFDPEEPARNTLEPTGIAFDVPTAEPTVRLALDFALEDVLPSGDVDPPLPQSPASGSAPELDTLETWLGRVHSRQQELLSQ